MDRLQNLLEGTGIPDWSAGFLAVQIIMETIPVTVLSIIWDVLHPAGQSKENCLKMNVSGLKKTAVWI